MSSKFSRRRYHRLRPPPVCKDKDTFRGSPPPPTIVAYWDDDWTFGNSGTGCTFSRQTQDNLATPASWFTTFDIGTDNQGFTLTITLAFQPGTRPTYVAQTTNPCGGGPTIYGTSPIIYNLQPTWDSGFITLEDASGNTVGTAQIHLHT